MTGLERNADVVYQATYAPLFAHVDGWQWKPDLIWFDNLNSVRSANWYVQMLYGTHKGTNMLKVTENGANVEGSNGLYASAVYDKIKKQYIVKVGNSAANAQQVTINLNGVKNVRKAQQTILKAAALTDENTIDHPDRIVPTTTDITATGNTITVSLPASSFSVFVFE